VNLSHLTRRFLAHGSAKTLTENERNSVAIRLADRALAELFFAQPVSDQRHGYDAGEWLAGRSVPPWMVQAGMLHDVGKRHAPMGRWRRAVATTLGWLRIVPPGAMSLYNAHGSTGADELAAVHADARVVVYTAHHHGHRPAELTVNEWEMLDEADRKN